MWYGEYIHTLDNKERFILPAKFREKAKELKRKKFYITRGLEGCLSIFAEEEWLRREEKLKSLPFTKTDSRAFNRLFFSGACEVEIDNQGRITLPEHLREFAQIKKEIVIIGVAESIEIWSKEIWEKFYKENKKNFENLAEKLF
ncbi:MAG: division/cell wall cluster transcriptional repressor MraZ [Candidatus Omnitrophota bacterium]